MYTVPTVKKQSETVLLLRICRMKLCTFTEYPELRKSSNRFALYRFAEYAEINLHVLSTYKPYGVFSENPE
jgi:hypothetical protein